MDKIADRIRGALFGVAIGDALGGPLEFMSAEEIRRTHGTVTEMIGGGWLNLKPGETTDDTAMTLAVAEGIAECPEDPVPYVGRNFIDWYNSGPKDIGSTCAGSIRRAMDIAAWKKMPTEREWMIASETTDHVMHGRTAGNGALMRTIYPALFYDPDRRMYEITENIAKMTHWSNESMRHCGYYVYIVNRFICGYKEPVHFDGTIHPPTGYVVDSFSVAAKAINDTCSFEGALVRAVNQGGDADTIGAITGGLAGARYGYSDIPARWLEALDPKVKEQLNNLADIAIKRREA